MSYFSENEIAAAMTVKLDDVLQPLENSDLLPQSASGY